jgi:hypothetical protein
MNIVILNWQRPLWEGDQEVVKRSGRDNTYVHGSNARNLSVELSLSQTSKNAMFFLLSFIFMFFLQQNQRTRGQNSFCLEAGEEKRWPI